MAITRKSHSIGFFDLTTKKTSETYFIALIIDRIGEVREDSRETIISLGSIRFDSKTGVVETGFVETRHKRAPRGTVGYTPSD